MIKVDPEIPFDEVALFGCAVMTGVGAVVNSARVPAGSSVAVVGLGGVGLCAILGALVAGARTIIAVDINPAKLKTALELGATAAFDARDPEVAEQIRAATDGGVEFAFETAGAVLAMQTAINITRRGGTTVTAGLPIRNTISLSRKSCSQLKNEPLRGLTLEVAFRHATFLVLSSFIKRALTGQSVAD